MATGKLLFSNFSQTSTSLRVIINHVQRRNMPVNVPPTATGKRRFRLAVETDPHKLVNYCCGLNYHQDEPLIKLKEDGEYPDWLWTLRLGPKPNSWELKEGTKEYYLRLHEEEVKLNHIRRTTKGQTKKVVNQVIKDNDEYVKRLRFAALAHLEDDAGLDAQSMPEDWAKSMQVLTKRSEYYLPMEEGRVLYMDKIEGNRRIKNYHRDLESSFNKGEVRIHRRRPVHLRAIQDSKQRHRYAFT